MQLKSDQELINLIKAGDSEAFKEISSRHSALVISVFSRYSPSFSFLGLNEADLYDEKNNIIYNSCLSFNSEKKSKFSTWLANNTRFFCLNTLNKRKISPLSEYKYNEFKDFFENSNIEDIKDTTKETVDFVLKTLSKMKDKRALKIFKLRYFNDKKNLSWNRVSKKVGMSPQGIINIHNKAAKFLANKLSKQLTEEKVRV